MSGKGRSYKRRKNIGVLYIPIAVLLVLFAAVFGTSVFLKIEYIEVIGVSKYTEEEIIEAAGVSKGDNLLLIDTSAVARRIIAAKPYVSMAKPVRKLPDTIRFELRESVAVAQVHAQGRVLIIDSAARVLEIVSESRELISVSGITPIDPVVGSPLQVDSNAEARLTYLTEVLAGLERAELANMTSTLDVSNIANISFVYDTRFRVILGGADDIDYKLGKMADVISRIPHSDTAMGTIDLSEHAKTLWTPE